MKKVFTILVLLTFVGWSYAQVTFWGTTNTGGSGVHDTGTIFTIHSDGSNYTEVLGLGGVNGLNGWNLTYDNIDLVQAGNGLFYGKNFRGGASRAGNIFSFNPATSAYNVISSFAASTANQGDLMLAKNGKMYGNVEVGGTFGFGYLFSLDTLGNMVDLFDYGPFFSSAVGYFVAGSFLQANNGLLYGMTGFGGGGSAGSIFKFDPATVSDGSPPTVIHTFPGTSADGGESLFNPNLIQGSDGLLYGMTTELGANNHGIVFCCDLNGNNYRVIYNFTGTPGADPVGKLTQAANGLLYGMNSDDTGPVGQYGALFSIDTNRTNATPYTTVQAFTATNQNPGSNGDVYLASDGNLYGYTVGTTASPLSAVADATLWEYNLTSSTFSTLYTFSASTGSNPDGLPQELRSLTTPVASPLCQHTSASIPVKAIGLYIYDNVFTAQLSDASGSFSSPTTLGTLSGAKSGTITATLPSGANGSGYKIRIVSSDPNFTGAPTSVVINDCWQGGNSANDWGTASNWTSGVAPSNLCGTGVSIPVNGNNPVVNSAVSIANITVTGAGRETFTLNSTLTLCGSWTDNAGTSSAATGSQVIFNGSSAQTISGNLTFDQLAIANTSGGVSLAAGTTAFINTSLLLETGNLNTTAGSLTLNSTTSSQAAIIDNFSGAASPDAGTLTGSVIAQRFYDAPITTNSYSQHEMGSPVSAPALSQFGVSGTPGYVSDFNCDGTKVDLSSPYGTVFGYDETHGTACGIQQWKVLTAGNAANGAGYSIRSGGPGTLSLTGTPNLSGNVTLTGTNSGWANSTLQGYPEQSGWTLASNPYPATLKISSGSLASNVTAGWDGVGVMVWNTTGGSAGTYQLATTIAPFQAFMVHKTVPHSGSSTYTIFAADRVTTANTFYKEVTANMLNITATNQSSGLFDVTNVGFNSNAVTGFDPNFDVHKIAGDVDRHALYTTSEGNWMYQNVSPSIEQAPTVQMGFAPGVSGTYTLKFDGVNSFDATSYITLEDTKLYIFHDVRSGDYTFTADASDDWGRFVLHFTPAASINSTNATCSEQGMINIVQPGEAIWNYTLADNNNVTLSAGVLSSNSPLSATVAAGVYTVTLIDNKGYTVVKTVEVSGVQPVVASFTTSANAVNVNQEVTLNSTAAGAVTNSWNFGDGTTENGATVTHSYTTEGVYNVTLNSSSVSGCNSSSTNTITVNRSVTGVTNLNDINSISIWSYENIINVDFSQLKDVQANIEIYNILGQKITEDKFTTSTVYRKEISTMEAGYVLVTVKNNDAIITKKLFIDNTK